MRLGGILVAMSSPVLVLPAVVAAAPPTATPPVAAVRPHAVVSPHGTRNDPYYWLRDDTRKNPEMLAYLAAENAYYAAMTAPYAALTEALFQEILGRIQQDDSSVPSKWKDFLYATRYESGKEYPLYVRTPVAGGAEQVMIDANAEAVGKGFYQVAGRAVSPDQKLLAFLDDTAGRRQYTLRVRDLATGKDLADRVTGLSGQVVWANDNRTLFYVENDPTTLLSTRVKRHVLGTDPKSDAVVYEEPDHSYYLGIHKSGDERFVMITLEATVSQETRFLDASTPTAEPRVLAPRQRDFLYDADHIDGRWVVRTNWNAPNYRLVTVADAEAGDRARWRELLPYDAKVFIEDFALFRDYLAINERSEGLLRIRALPWAAPEKAFYLQSDEPAYVASLNVNPEQDTTILRYDYSSLTTPDTIYDVDMKSGERTLRKRQPVLGYDPTQYATERLWATARDGVKVPVSLVYRKGFTRDGKAPLYQAAYGSYGSSSDPVFQSAMVSLLDRGFVYAVAHVRGGQEMGRAWYDDGHLMKKRNTFTDFIDVTDFLVKEKVAAPDKVFAAGGSAGGLLMGAIANMAPEKYRGILAAVPFVDAVTTMLDETIPLTSNEFDEWGNPKEKAAYDYILSYSPYDNVRAQAYPALYVTTGLWDSQVQYYEPAKWVAKLRATKTDDHLLLFKVNMEAGHGGRSGRFQRQRDVAERFAFVLHELGIER